MTQELGAAGQPEPVPQSLGNRMHAKTNRQDKRSGARRVQKDASPTPPTPQHTSAAVMPASMVFPSDLPYLIPLPSLTTRRNDCMLKWFPRTTKLTSVLGRICTRIPPSRATDPCARRGPRLHFPPQSDPSLPPLPQDLPALPEDGATSARDQSIRTCRSGRSHRCS